MKNKTTITVAHRFETIKNSDQINVLEAGQIVEQGKYEDLVNKKGYFYNVLRGHEIWWLSPMYNRFNFENKYKY